ncbi:MAG: bacillithiol biosynthesis cysteine-adding enzyme BshC [Flavobacteriaceae bacterium]
MPSDCITFQNSGYFSEIITDYLNQSEKVKPFYKHFPTLDNFRLQIKEKQNFNTENRKILTSALQKQYQGLRVSGITQQNIELLNQKNTFTITTGHQLNLFSGHLYFVYKIISVIKLCQQLKQQYPENHFVPIYWMATEDHDFEEINHFLLHEKKIVWNKPSGGAVGEFDTEGLTEVFKVLSTELGISTHAQYLKDLFEDSYLKHDNLADATRFLVNELFSEYGLVILDGNDKNLKKLFAPYIQQELQNQVSFTKVSETLRDFPYSVQVNPREINLFYLDKNLRERIIKENDTYIINNTNLKFSESELLDILHSQPEKFSPNVILRPLYQEVILPNLCYVGGGGELAYWLELKAFFEEVKVPFPVLLLRNSAVLVSEKQNRKREKLSLTFADLFEKQPKLVDRKAKAFSEIDIDFAELKSQLQKQFETLKAAVAKTDKSFTGAVNAQERKQIKGLENLEKRLLKAHKKYFAEQLKQIIALQNELFPNQSLQERQNNFAEYYSEYGKLFFDKLFDQLEPLAQNFNVVIF